MKKQMKANGYGVEGPVEAPLGVAASLGNACRIDGRIRRNRLVFADCAGSQPCH
ncbi:hypothetical protein [Maricaulis sp. W15]|uniref:hypothetical protein n=1 Tax=Maricaulis sp. W15 TaxID=1772333 RepID=UPI000ACA3F6F|nr:hypothetical protein [Maricaulis sp. W15]